MSDKSREAFVANLKRIMEIRGVNQDYIVQNLGVRASTVSDWCRGKKYPRPDAIDKLAALFGVDVSDLVGKSLIDIFAGVGNVDIVSKTPSPLEKLASINYTPLNPVRVIGTVRCGIGGLAFEDDLGYEGADVRNPDDYIYFRAEGDSMEPRICEGDLALVHLQNEVCSGDLAVVVVDGEEGLLKRVIIQPGVIILQSFNSSYEPRIFAGEDTSLVKFVGKVTQTVRKW